MPILGIIASAISGNLFAPSGAYDSIATVTLTTTSSSITFSSIPATYTHLQLRSFVLSNSVSGSATMTINSTNGGTHWLSGDGASATANVALSTMYLPLVQGSTTSGFGGVTDFLDYKDTNKYKTVRTLGGYESNSTGFVALQSGNWRSTSAITSITLAPNIGSNFNQYSQFALYGIKGA